MKSIPHDFYLKFLDPATLEDVQHFHNKANFTIHESVKNTTYLHNIQEETLKKLTGNELQIYPDMQLLLNHSRLLPLPEESDLSRDNSCNFFKSQNIEFKKIEKIFSPLITKKLSTHNRGYPSGGALYPVEVFCCNLLEQNIEWPCKENILHLLPNSRTFEKTQGSEDISLLQRAILPEGSTIGSPPLAIIYSCYMPKTLFKYRHRGYRLAMMEVGSMYMLLDLQCKKLGLASRIWSAYTDNMLTKCLGLNPTLFYTACVQFIGVKK